MTGRAGRGGVAGAAVAVAVAVSVSVAAGGRALAFSTEGCFHTPPNPTAEGSGPIDGAQPQYFTGSERSHGHTCADCHVGAPGRVRIEMSSTPPGLFDAYQPGMAYLVDVKLVNETLGHSQDGLTHGMSCDASITVPGVPCNDNGFALEVQGADGSPVGALCANPQSTASGCVAANPSLNCAPDATSSAGCVSTDTSDPTVVLARSYRDDPVEWQLVYIAPQASQYQGPLVISAAAVDGNGGDRATFHDVIGDDVAAVQYVSYPAGAAPPGFTSGCDAGRPPGGPGPDRAPLLAGLLAAWAIAAAGRRARRRR